MNGWKYEWPAQLPPEVYDVIVEEMTKQDTQTENSNAFE